MMLNLIRGMNQGYSADELSHMIKLPEWFENDSWLNQARGEIPWYVKQIYYGNLGWFEGDPAFLVSLSFDEKSGKIVEGFGGIMKTIQKIRDAISKGEYEWAAELSTYALHVEPDNVEIKLLKAHALRVLGQRMLSADGRNWSLTSALELEGKITVEQNTFSQTSSKQLTELPISEILKTLPTKINPEKLGDENTILNVLYSDIDEDYAFHFRNGILAITSGISENADYSMMLDSNTHKLIIGGYMTLDDAIKSGLVDVSGDEDVIKEIMGWFDPLTINTYGIRD